MPKNVQFKLWLSFHVLGPYVSIGWNT